MRFLILGNSITSNLRVTGATTETIPGLDWQGAQNYLLANRETLRNTVLYVIVGPVRFTSLHQTRREVAFVEPRKSVHQLFSVFYTEHRAYNIIYGNTCNTQYIGDGENAVESALINKICYSSLIDKIDCINHKVKVSILLSK